MPKILIKVYRENFHFKNIAEFYNLKIWLLKFISFSYFEIVGYVLEDFRAHVVWGPNQSEGHLSILEHLGYPQVTHFDQIGSGEKHVLSLQVPVQNLLRMKKL